ncbi:very short patch repair endonuclease [Paenibacillus sp. GCM10027628]|uniref:very short patch repair endonuclease n=1 Tax=Paenibacillus sp. GCM10027628 TaxID=3273413 RepID=UPI003638BB08
MDNLSESDRRKNMQNIRSTGTKMELRVLQALWKRGLRYRKNVKDLPGKPDISIKKYKIVVFLDSCFFHGCKEHFIMPASNTEYWSKKIERNKIRDLEVSKDYESRGWLVLRFWEHETKKELEKVIETILTAVEKRKKR